MADYTGVSLPPLDSPLTSNNGIRLGIPFPPLPSPITASYVVIVTRPTFGQLYPRGYK